MKSNIEIKDQKTETIKKLFKSFFLKKSTQYKKKDLFDILKTTFLEILIFWI